MSVGNSGLGSVTLEVDNACVCYRVYEEPSGGLKAGFVRGQTRRRYRTVDAVRGVSVTLRERETLGLIGSNGSGKSTLLSAMTGLLPLASGSIRGRSRPSLLGVSSALRPALSGRRNIVIGGLALGFTRAEIAAFSDEIIEFTGLQDVIDLPMGTYSTGMRARLHFAIATAQIPDILLIDETLAVGDEKFRQLAATRLEDIRCAAGSVVLVTHNMAEIEQFCDRVAWMEDGRFRAIGAPMEVISMYTGAPRS